MHITVGGVQREALLFGPTQVPSSPKAPLVFAFHGHSQTPTELSSKMDLQASWPAAFVLYPKGVVGRPSPHDLCGQNIGWQSYANMCGGIGNQDIDFFDAMLNAMELQHAIDAQRVYVTGFSNGAVFSYLLWAHRAPKLAAIAVCAGRLWDKETLTVARPFLSTAGEADRVLPYCSQEWSIEDAKTANLATGPGQPVGPQPLGQKWTKYPSPAMTPVITCVHSGGHEIPPGAPPRIVEFFKAHSL